MTKILSYKLFRSKKERAAYKNRIINVLSNIGSTVLKETLWNYTGNVHIAEEDRPRINAKSEFLYSRVLVTHAKKSYIGYMTRQEGVVFDKPKIDLKGIALYKSTSTELTTAFATNELLLHQIFNPDGGQISLRDIYRSTMEYRQRMAEEIRAGQLGYLKRSVKVKSMDAYSEPLRINQCRAVYIWNSVVPDKERIELPATVTVVKVKLKTRKDVAALAPWPKIYNAMMALFDDPNFGDHEETTNGKTRMVRGKGINAIAIPSELDEAPDWIRPIIDVETIVQENFKLMEQIFKSLGFSPGNISINGNTFKYYTNIVRI